jgi:outer membrane protein TolC
MLTGFQIGPDVTLTIPDSILGFKTSQRPEYKYFDAESKQLQSMISLKSRQNMPKLYAYGQLGYSYPGLNLFENQSDYYYIIGARLSWTIFDWWQVNRESQILKKQQEIISTKRTDFERTREQLINQENIEQEKIRELLVMDEKIIEQRGSIATGSASALQNGMITAAVYLEDLNNEIGARIELETHKIQLMNSLVRMYLLYGIDTNFDHVEFN